MTEKKKITIHEALAELKLLDKRIRKGQDNLAIIGISIGKKMFDTGKEEEKFKSEAPSSYDSVISLIERKSAIKSAIMQSNAVTKVTINNKELTVSQAIELKQSVELKRSFLDRLKNVEGTYKNKFASSIEMFDKKQEKLLSEALQADKGTLSGEKFQEKIKSLSSIFDDSKPVLVDPLNIAEKIKTLSDEIDEFESTVDFKLSESNARTLIEV